MEKKKLIFNIDPIRSMEEAKIIAGFLKEIVKENKDRDILLNFKQIDGSRSVFEMPSEEKK